MTETPGQLACIAWNAHYAEEHGITARNEWAASDPRGRAAWEAAADAGAERHRLERDQARGQLAETTAELDRIKQQYAAWLGRYTSNGSGWNDRVSGTVLARAYRDANLPVRDDLSHLAGS